MAEIKKINGNTLCDDTAREKANGAKTTADEAKSAADTNEGKIETLEQKIKEIPTYTAGTGIAISDTGEVSADTAVLATKAGGLPVVPWKDAFTHRAYQDFGPYITYRDDSTYGRIVYFVLAGTAYFDDLPPVYISGGFRFLLGEVQRLQPFRAHVALGEEVGGDGATFYDYSVIEASDFYGIVTNKSGYLVNVYSMEDTAAEKFYLKTSTGDSSTRHTVTVNDTDGLLLDGNPVAKSYDSEDWTFTLESGETVTKKVVLG